MKQVIGIWLCAILIGILGVFYVNWCIDSAMSGFERTTTVDASSYLGSMYYDEALGQVVCEGEWHPPLKTCEQLQADTRMRVSTDVVVGVESYQGFEDNTGYRVQPAQVRSLEYRVPTIIQQ